MYETGKPFKVAGFREMLEILEKYEVSNIPTYSGYGLEIYQDNKKQVQIIFNLRDGEDTITINKGF
jgi:tRNA A37 threonylcarbamoyladenosine synthetase subunit TsaC/SUA5/YrdC